MDWPDPEGDPILSAQQWLAGRFNVNAHTVVTAASAYLSAGPSGGIVNFTLYATAGGMNELFTVPVSIPDVSFDRVGNAIPAWYGPSNVAWSIEPGEYWLALEVRAGSTFEGFVATRAPFPLACDGDSNASTVYGCDGIGLPIRVEAAAAVPEASSLLLLLSGLLGLHLLPQRRRAVHA